MSSSSSYFITSFHFADWPLPRDLMRFCLANLLKTLRTISRLTLGNPFKTDVFTHLIVLLIQGQKQPENCLLTFMPPSPRASKDLQGELSIGFSIMACFIVLPLP